MVLNIPDLKKLVSLPNFIRKVLLLKQVKHLSPVARAYVRACARASPVARACVRARARACARASPVARACVRANARVCVKPLNANMV